MTNPREAKTKKRRAEHAAVRPVVLLAALLLIGTLVGLVWFRRPPNATRADDSRTTTEEAYSPSGLSDATRAVLQRLGAPVEIRFYALLNDSQAAEPRKAYAGRVTQLLAEYERAGEGKLVVKRFDSPSRDGTLAAKDGLEAVRLGRGEQNYLGMAVICQGQKVVLPSLSPEWEAALEFDLSRAIARAATGVAGGSELVVNPAPANAAATDELLKALPEVESLSLIEATQKVKAAGLEEFKTAVGQMQAELAKAQQNLAAAQQKGPEAAQAARIKLEQLQVEQNEKLGEISERMQGRLAALQRLKQATP